MSKVKSLKAQAKIVTNKGEYEILQNKLNFAVVQSNFNKKTEDSLTLVAVEENEIENGKKIAFSIEKEDDQQDAYKPFLFRSYIDNFFMINDKPFRKGQKRIIVNKDTIVSAKNPLNRFFVFHDLRDMGDMITKDSYPVQITKEYFVEKIIGTGGSGSTFLVHHVRTLNKLAVKKVKKCSNESSNDYAYEAKIMNNLNHVNVVKLLTVFDQSDHTFIFTEYLNNKDLFKFIISKKNTRLDEIEAKDAFYQVTQGLKYLHNLNICHRDIKCENIFVNKDQNNVLTFKIGDFGLSAYDKNLNENCGTKFYMAPEMLNQKKPITYSGKKCDIWSLGVVLFCMMSGKFPFHNSFRKLYGPIEKQISDADVRFRVDTIWCNVSYSCKHLICCMISKNSIERYNIHQVVKHPWLHSKQPQITQNLRKRPLEPTLSLNVNCNAQDIVAKKLKTCHVDQNMNKI